MKRTIETFKQNPLEAIILTVCILFLCISGTYIAPILVNAVAKSNPIGLGEWIIGIAIPAISALGAVLCIIRINKITLKRKLIAKLLVTAGLWLLLEVIFIFFSEIITEAVCNMITGSILTAKIALGITLPLLKLPAYAVLLCMVCNISREEKMLSKVKAKRYLYLLAVLLIIHVVKLCCSMAGAVMVSGILQCILLSALAVSAMFFAKETEGVYEYEKALV